MVASSITFMLAVIFLVIGITTVIATTATAQQGRIQEESDRGLTAILNTDSFTTGDTITVNGTVEERNPGSYVSIEVKDSQGRTVERQLIRVNEDNKFAYSFVAGRIVEFDPDFSMVESGNYTMSVSYFPPYDIFDKEVVEFVFQYNRAPTATGATTNGARISDNTTSSASAINITAINQSAAHAMRHTELAYLAIQENDTRDVVLGNLDVVLDALESVQGNLTNTATTSNRR